MIEAADITDFQAHTATRIEFERITTITGVTDAGKSAVMRAIRWPALNVPKGRDFIRTGASLASVTLVVDGQEITRERSKSKNKYHMDGAEFVSFGDKVPEQIAEVLRVGPVNFQDQHDPPYWFCLSAGDVSKQLNSIVNLQVIDTCLGNLNHGKNSAIQRKSVIQERMRDLEAELSELQYVKPFKKAVDKLTELEKKRDNLQGQVARLGVRASTAEAHHDFVTEADDCIKASQKILRLGHEYATKEAKAARVLRLVMDLGVYEARIHEGLDLPSRTELSKIEAKVCSLRGLIGKADQVNDQVVESQADLDQAKIALKDMIKDGCPLCGK